MEGGFFFPPCDKHMHEQADTKQGMHKGEEEHMKDFLPIELAKQDNWTALL